MISGYGIVGCLFQKIYFYGTLTLNLSNPRMWICSFACSLLRQGMKQIIINLDTPEILALEKAGEKTAIAKVLYSMAFSFIGSKLR